MCLIATKHSATSGNLRSAVVLVNTIATLTRDGTISIAIAGGLAEATGIDLRCTTTSPGRRDDWINPLEWSKVGITAVVRVGGIAGSTAGTLTGICASVAAHFTSVELAGSTTSTARGNQFNIRGRCRRGRRGEKRRDCRRCGCITSLATQIGVAILSGRLAHR